MAQAKPDFTNNNFVGVVTSNDQSDKIVLIKCELPKIDCPHIFACFPTCMQ